MNSEIVVSGGETSKTTQPRRSLTPKDFKKKVDGLKKQIYELTTLCSVPACLIIRSPDNSQTYTWPESHDEVKKFAVDYYAKKNNGKNPIENFQRFKGLPIDEERRFVKALDEKIEALKKRMEFIKTLEKNGTSEGSERMLTNGGSDDLRDGDDENRDMVRELERVTEAYKERNKGKRKLGECGLVGTSEGSKKMLKIAGSDDLSLIEEDDENWDMVREMERLTEAYKKWNKGKRKLGDCSEDEKFKNEKVRKLVQELQGFFTDTKDDDDDDDASWLTLGR